MAALGDLLKVEDAPWFKDLPRDERRKLLREQRTMGRARARLKIPKPKPAAKLDLASLVCAECHEPMPTHDLKTGRCPLGVIEGKGVYLGALS